MSDLVSYEVRDRIAHVTITNGKANALVARGHRRARRRGQPGRGRGRRPRSARCCITGHARHAHAAASTSQVMRVGRRGRGPARHRRRRAVHPPVRRPRCPVIVACTGHAVAAGALLLLGADYRDRRARASSASASSRPSSAWCCRAGRSSWREERLSPRHFQHATVGARMYDPDGAADAGFLDTVVAPDALAAAAAAEAQYWAGLPRGAYRGQVLDEPGRPARPARRRDRRRSGPHVRHPGVTLRMR